MVESGISTAQSAVYTYRKARLTEERIDTSARYTVYVIRSGSATLTAGNEIYALRAADIVIAKDGGSYGISEIDEGCTADVISFRSYLLRERVRAALKRVPTVVRSAEAHKEISEIAERIASESRRADELSEEAAIGLIQTLSVTLARCADKGAEPSELSAPVAAALSHVNGHLGEKLTLTEVAAACEVSAPHLSRKFKSEVGVGFADYVATARLERAGSMLREHPELSITEIAFSCGFNDSNYFSDKFKHHFGIPPLRFRKLQ